MNYSDLYFMISIALQLLIFFEIRRRSKSNVMLLMSLLITVLCVLFFYNVFLLGKTENIILFWYVSCCISYVPMECELSFQKDSKMRDYLSFFLRKELCYNGGV